MSGVPIANQSLARTSFPFIRIAFLGIIVAAIAYVEWHRPFAQFRLLTFVLFFMALADLTWFARGRVRDFLLIMTSLAFGVIFIEGAANIIGPNVRETDTPPMSISQPIMGWGPQHPGHFHANKIDLRTGATIYDVNYSIDSHLLRQTQSCERGRAIVFVGCSFTFGSGLNDNETLPQSFADLLDHRVKILNLAYVGYGPQHFLRALETGYFDKIIGPRPSLFIFLTAPWHADRTSCKASWTARAPRYALQDDKVVFKGACNERLSLWLRMFLHDIAAYRLFFEPRFRVTHDDIDLYIRIVIAAVKLAKEKYGAPTLIAYMRADKGFLHGTGFSDDEITRRLQDGGAVVADASLSKGTADASRFAIPGDGHPTALANKLRASLLQAYIQRHFPSLVPPAPQSCGPDGSFAIDAQSSSSLQTGRSATEDNPLPSSNSTDEPAKPNESE